MTLTSASVFDARTCTQPSGHATRTPSERSIVAASGDPTASRNACSAAKTLSGAFGTASFTIDTGGRSFTSADNGRPAIDPVLVAGVTLLQFMEKAPDRQAVERLRLHLGWKHALGLAVDYAGFHPTTLVYFRQRLLEHQQSRVVFDALLQGLESKGLIPRRGKQRLDSSHILGPVAQMSRLEKTRETVRLFLEMLERKGRE